MPADSAKLTEGAYLSQQADSAKAAIARAVGEMKSSLLKGSSPAAWTRADPWLGVGAGAAAGLVAGLMLVPSREEQALRRLRKIEAALHPEKSPSKENGKSDGAPAHKGWIGLILKELLGVVGPLIANVLNAQTSAATAEPQSSDETGATNLPS